MCGRFNVIDSPGLQQLLRDLGIDLTLPRGVNLAPTEPVQLVRELGRSALVADALLGAGSGPEVRHVQRPQRNAGQQPRFCPSVQVATRHRAHEQLY